MYKSKRWKYGGGSYYLKILSFYVESTTAVINTTISYFITVATTENIIVRALVNISTSKCENNQIKSNI